MRIRGAKAVVSRAAHAGQKRDLRPVPSGAPAPWEPREAGRPRGLAGRRAPDPATRLRAVRSRPCSSGEMPDDSDKLQGLCALRKLESEKCLKMARTNSWHKIIHFALFLLYPLSQQISSKKPTGNGF